MSVMGEGEEVSVPEEMSGVVEKDVKYSQSGL